MAVRKWQKEIESAAFDLTHMEINTIIASEMTAAKSPSRPREMLYKIAEKYDRKLQELTEQYNLIKDDTPLQTKLSFLGVVRQCGYYSYEELQDRANLVENGMRKKSAYVDKTEEEIDSDLAMLHRIRRNAQEIKDILYQTDSRITLDKNGELQEKVKADLPNWWQQTFSSKLPTAKEHELKLEVNSDTKALITQLLHNGEIVTKGDFPEALNKSRSDEHRNVRDSGELDLDLRQLSILKKAFDIGTSTVVMQTIIGLDGDVTTRIAKSFANNPIPLVNELHHDGIRISVDYWKTIINALKAFGEAIIKTFK